jgi:hypothetical protein
MKRAVAFGLVALVLVTAPGCGGKDALMKEALAHLNAYAETIEKKESLDRQLGTLDRFRSVAEKLDKYPEPEKEELRKRYESDLKRVRDRIDAAFKNQVLEGGSPQANPVDSLLAKTGDKTPPNK